MLIIKEDQTIFPEKPLKYQKYEYQKIQMLDTFQAVRYGFYRKSDFKKEKIKKIIVNLNPFLKNINSSDPLVIAIKSLTKNFIGELVEFSKQLMFEIEENVEWKETPISKKILKRALKLSFFNYKHVHIV
jgi:hypothetical protein